MDRNKIKKLAKTSFIGNRIDSEKVFRVSKLLKKSFLKEYIRYLKRLNEERTIMIIVPDEDLENLSVLAKKIRNTYPNKKIVVKVDPNLIGGVRIINGDVIYEASVKGILEEVSNKI